MSGVILGIDQLFRQQQIELFLHTLTADTHAFGDLRRGGRCFAAGNSAQHLPARGGELTGGGKTIAPSGDLAVQAKNAQHQLAYGLMGHSISGKKIDNQFALCENWLSKMYRYVSCARAGQFVEKPSIYPAWRAFYFAGFWQPDCGSAAQGWQLSRS